MPYLRDTTLQDQRLEPLEPKVPSERKEQVQEQDGLFRFSSVQRREACLLLHCHKGSLLQEKKSRALFKLLQFYLFAC